MDCSPPVCSVHGILQARILEWVFPSPGDPPNPGIEPGSPAFCRQILYVYTHIYVYTCNTKVHPLFRCLFVVVVVVVAVLVSLNCTAEPYVFYYLLEKFFVVIEG